MNNKLNEAIDEVYTKGKIVIYDSHGADSELNERTGETAVILRSLNSDECDKAEVGNMYRIKFDSDGYETDAFEDELIPCMLDKTATIEQIKVRAQRNMLNDKRNFIYAVKTVAELYKSLDMMQSIGIMVEGAKEGVGACIWKSITSSTNIALLLMNHSIGDDLANEVFLDFVERYIKNNMIDKDISAFYATYKNFGNNAAMVKHELERLNSRYDYYCDDCPTRRNGEECDIDCQSKKESLLKRIKLLRRVESNL